MTPLAHSSQRMEGREPQSSQSDSADGRGRLAGWRAVFLRILLALASVMVALLISEGIVRIVAPQSSSVPWYDEMNGIQCSRPNIRGQHASPGAFCVTVSINAQRFRSRWPVGRIPAPGVTRIAALGDSFTFGWGVEDDETYPAQLEQILRRGLDGISSRPMTEVINAGNSNTGTGEQALWYEMWVKQFHPHVVVATVYANDVDDDLQRNVFALDERGRAAPRPLKAIRKADRTRRIIRRIVNAFPGYRFLAQHSQLLCLARTQMSRWIAARRSRALKPKAAPRRAPTPSAATAAPASTANKPQDAFHARGLPLMAAEFRWLNARVRQDGARLAVVFVPGRESVYPRYGPGPSDRKRKADWIVQTLRRVCTEEALPFLDVTPVLRDRARKTQEPLYYAGRDDHATVMGNRVIAETVAKFLVHQKLLQLPVGETAPRRR